MYSNFYILRLSSYGLKFLRLITSHLLDSFSDSSASKTAAPINKYVKVQTTKDKVRTFCRRIIKKLTTQKMKFCSIM